MGKKKFLVSKVKADRDMTGIRVDGQEMKFSRSGESFYLSDEGMAKEVQQTLGQDGTKDVVVSGLDVRDRGHKYTFTIRKPECKEPGCKRLPASDSGYCEEHEK